MTNGSQFAAAFRVFLSSANEEDFLILLDPGHDNQFVQYKLRNRVIYGEVSSRQWSSGDADKPLTDGAEFALMRLGFTHGGRAKNYCQDNLPADPLYLARLTDQLFTTAYEMPAPVRPNLVSTTPALVTWAQQRGQFAPAGAPTHPPGTTCPCGYDHNDEPPLETSPGLAARAFRAMQSNFMRMQLDCEDRLRFRAAVEAVTRFEDLPDWAQDYILKAEEGPLF